MRELKFRAWDKKNKKMIGEQAIIFHKHGSTNLSITFEGLVRKDFSCCAGSDDVDFVGGTEFELMQFTGLKDKEGTEIYEGDIVKVGTWGNFEVKYGEHSYEGYYGAYGFYLSEEDDFFISELKRCKVVGNKFENPELLEESK